MSDVDDLVADHLDLAQYLARHYSGQYPALDRAEFESDACVALLKAARSYDPAIGTFVGYLRRQVRQALTDCLRRQLGRPTRSEGGQRRGGINAAAQYRPAWTRPLSDLEGHDPPCWELGYDQALNRVVLAATFQRLEPTDRERTVLEVVATGGTLRTAGAAIGVSESRACQMLIAIRARAVELGLS